MFEVKWKWLLLLVLTAIAPFVYAIFQGYWALLLVPVGQLFSVSGKVPYAILIVVMNLCGALIVAILLALPLGYVAKCRPYMFGALLSLAPLIFLLWVAEDWLDVTSFLGAIRIAEYLSIIISFVVMARLGAYIRKLRYQST
jgi:hypothetical protein